MTQWSRGKCARISSVKIDFTIGLPPSVNALYRAVRGRSIKSKPYRAWENVALQEMALKGIKPLSGPYFHAEYIFDRPDRRRRDVDNYVKATADILVKAGLIEDDKLIEKFTASWSDREPRTPAEVRIILWNKM